MAISSVFLYLQLLDLMTTLVGFKLGAREGPVTKTAVNLSDT